jgi:hypothetical protein
LDQVKPLTLTWPSAEAGVARAIAAAIIAAVISILLAQFFGVTGTSGRSIHGDPDIAEARGK